MAPSGFTLLSRCTSSPNSAWHLKDTQSGELPADRCRVVAHLRLNGYLTRRSAAGDVELLILEQEPAVRILCYTPSTSHSSSKRSQRLWGTADVDCDVAPPSLIESPCAERETRRVTSEDRNPDVNRLQRSGPLDHEADAERQQHL